MLCSKGNMGQQITAHRLILAHLMSLLIKFYWHMPMPILLCTVCGCFPTTMAELRSCNRDHMACKVILFSVWHFTENYCHPLD